jgi:uncharacterized protein with von Willebrand factor type A (vWA) domain
MAMDFKSAGDRVRSLIAAKKPGQLSRSALTPSPLRDRVMRETEERSPRFQAYTNDVPEVEYQVERDGQQVTEKFEWTSYGEAVRDVGRAGFSYDEPELLSPDKVRPSHQFNREMLASTLANEEFDAARPYTRNDEVESQYTAMKFAQTLKDAAPEVAEHIARAQQMEQAEQQVDSAEEMLERLRQRARDEITADGEVSDPTKRDIKREVKARANGKDQLGQLIDAHVQSNYVQAAAKVGREAAAAMKDAAEAMSALPGVEPGQAHNISPDTQIALAEKWAKNPNTKAILEMLGRMQVDFKFKRQARTKNVRIEPVGVTTGNDVESLLPHEFARAYHPTLKPLFMKDFAERSLLQYEFAGKERAGKGPIIELHDGSGSMAGEKFVWASSLGLTLATGAAREKRDFAGIEFGSSGQVKSWMFLAHDPPDPEKLLDFATHFYSGGTSTVGGFREALRIMRDYPQFETADVILIGDGLDRFTDADRKVRDELRALNVRIHGITIMTPSNPYFEQMCDWHMDVQELAGPNDATDALAEQLT